MEAPLKQLFQQEFSKMVAVISRLFGLEHIETAEDIVSETFLKAVETWGDQGLPPNPTAWLYAVAKQKALYRFRRNSIYERSEEHTSELQSLMRISYAVFCLKKKNNTKYNKHKISSNY